MPRLVEVLLAFKFTFEDHIIEEAAYLYWGHSVSDVLSVVMKCERRGTLFFVPSPTKGQQRNLRPFQP
jgi:hypothetical protein